MNNNHSSRAQVAEVLHNLFVLSKHLSLHDEKNAIVRDATDKLVKQLTECFHQEIIIQVSVAKYSFLFEGEPLSPQNKLFTDFAFGMFQHGIATFNLTPDLTVNELYAFLRLLMEKPSETWDQGGIRACLEQLKITGVQVTEMSREDFNLLEGHKDSLLFEHTQSANEFWQQFARALLSVFAEDIEEEIDSDSISSAELAEKISALLKLGEEDHRNARQERLSQLVNQSVSAAQSQKDQSEKAATYLKLASFVSHLDQKTRKRLLAGVCNLQLLKNNAELFFNGFSDDAILDAFQQVSQHNSHASPIVMSLISKLAGAKNLASAEELAVVQATREERIKQTKELLLGDQFDKYVPSRYQKTLRKILSSQQIPQALSSHLQKLKTDLEDVRIEQQIANIALYILEHSADQTHLSVLHKQLAEAIGFFLASADYRSLVDLCRRFLAGKSADEIATLANLLPSTFYSQALKDVARLGKNYHPLLNELIDQFGPAFAPHLLEAVNIEADRAARLLFLNNLRKIGTSVDNISKLISPYLADRRWYVVRNMLFLLGSLGNKKDLPQIRPFREHKHHRVRQEALKTCLLLKDVSSLKQLQKDLSSANQEDVLYAISLLGLVHIPELITKLLILLKEEKLFKFDFEVKKAVVHSLGNHREERALAIFSKILKNKKLLHARTYNQLKLEIVKTLQNYPAEQALPLLKQQVEEGTGDAKLQARHVMQKLSGRSET